MQYAMLLWPHANSRYQEAARPLSTAELLLLLGEKSLSDPRFEQIGGVPFLRFDSPLAAPELHAALSDHAHLYLLTEVQQHGCLIPIGGQRPAYLGQDLPSILKYKGKTNEVFTHFLINMAAHSSAFAGKAQTRLRLLDPMCGRGTALFDAINRGWDAVGADIDRADIHEADAFFKRYLEYHKFKHQAKELSLTLPGRRAIPRKLYRFASTPEAFKANEVSELSLINADAQDAISALPQKHFHVAAIDLPYGVQHAPGARGKIEPVEALLRRTLPLLRERLLPGGAVALSFNVNNLPLEKARDLLRQARFEVMTGDAYDHLGHWVEQAVTRDAAVGVRLR